MKDFSRGKGQENCKENEDGLNAMLNQGLLIYSWMTCHDIWKNTL